MLRPTLFLARLATCTIVAGALSLATAGPAHAAAVRATAPAPTTSGLTTATAGLTTATVPADEVHTDTLDLVAADGRPGSFELAGIEPFVAIGFTWQGAQGAEASLVITYADGEVTAPIDLDQDGAHGGDRAPTDDRRVTDPVALDKPATGFAVTVPAELRDVQAHVVRNGAAAGAASDRAASDNAVSDNAVSDNAASFVEKATADGIPGPEGIRTRDSWGARPRKPTEPCAPGGQPEGLGCVSKYGVVNAVVHHTVNANDYSAASVPALLRSIQAFHQDTQEFDDIAYNFIVDRFGTIWEGRAGGADRPVVGAHTMGFNTGSVGVAVLGTFDGAAPSAAALEGVAQIIAWKFAQRNVDPLGQVTVVSNGGDLHEIGTAVTLPTIDGHRSIGATACPGAQLFARLGAIRQRVAELMPLYTGEVNGFDRFSGQMRLTGYAMRRDTATPVAVTLTVDGVPAGQAVANLPRADVAGRFPAIGANHGFEFVVPASLGARRACVTENLTGTLVGCRDVNPVTPAFGDFGFTTTASPPRIGLSGWAIDPDSSEPTVVHVYVDGVYAQYWADKPRPDIASVYPGYGTNRGFSTDIDTTQGVHQICVFAINIPAGSHTLMGCREAVVGQVNRSAPIGTLDLVSGGGASVVVSGWALDRDSSAALNVHVYVDNALTPIVANVARPDVAAIIPGAGARTGFAATVAASPGPHTVCVYAIDANLVGPHTLLGCRAVSVLAPNATPPFGVIDNIAVGGGSVSLLGWAIDPDTAAPIAVHVYIDATLTPLTAAGNRSDIAAAYPAFGAAHGFGATLSAVRGNHQVCVYAINNLTSAAATLLGCRIVNVL